MFFDDIHDFELRDAHKVGQSYYECNRCGFRVSGHALDQLHFDISPYFSVLIRPCRKERYQYCTCGRIAGDGADNTCVYSEKKTSCARCGQRFLGHHNCEQELLIKNKVKQLNRHHIKGLLERYFK